MNLQNKKLIKEMATFALPYLFSYFLQTLYGMADLFIIGQFDTVASTTAVSIGSQVMHMITVMIVGLAMGSTVIIARNKGAKKEENVSISIANTITLFMSLSILLTIILLLLSKYIVQIMSTPSEATTGTLHYLIICFVGIPCITAYNIISSIFRGLGDSKSPMYFIGVACVINILLDYLFMGYFHLGPIGAALGTTLSQAFSIIFALIWIKKKDLGIHLHKKDFSFHPTIFKQILRIGIPVALQDGFIQIAFIVITIIANKRGLNQAAAVGIVEKIISFLFLVPSSMLSTISALGAQYIGAKQKENTSSLLKYGIIITCSFGLIVGILMQFIAGNVVNLFNHDPLVINYGAQYLRGYIWDCFFAGIHFSFSGFFCAYGRSEISFIHNICAILLVRIPGVYLTSLYFPATLYPMGLATACGSLFSVIICIVAYKLLKKNKIF